MQSTHRHAHAQAEGRGAPIDHNGDPDLAATLNVAADKRDLIERMQAWLGGCDDIRRGVGGKRRAFELMEHPWPAGDVARAASMTGTHPWPAGRSSEPPA
jgi:hypothetical protein